MTNGHTSALQDRFYHVIFGTESTAGRAFDFALIGMILASVVVILLDSLPHYHSRHGDTFLLIEWLFTGFFTLEYMVRIWCTPNRRAYILSIYGLVDLFAILPTYIALLIPGAAPLLIVRLLRILRIFRILRLIQYIREANTLAGALRRSARKIVVFFSMMMIITTIFGCLVYVLEGPDNGFDNIPMSIYWAIVTITTVGYGDVVPVTVAGRFVSAVGMLLGYAIIAVPTGIITAELTSEIHRERNSRNCRNCTRSGHDANALFCMHCGADL
ncbi:MAG: ion transporter [Halieaceae bacterium]|jgi:voltage-gated potassium channel|nr:ion transporter [Halieaceae bacterium]